MVYKSRYSSDGSLNGYMNFTLSYFSPSDFERSLQHNSTAMNLNHPEHCRYHGYRYPPGHPEEYQYTEVFWHILAARLTFVVVFQNLVQLAVMGVRLLIPNMASDMKERVRREAYLTSEIIIRMDLLRARGQLDKVAVLREEYPDDEKAGNAEDGGGGDQSDRSLITKRCPRRDTGDITDGQIVV